jgi:hypothetical protein
VRRIYVTEEAYEALVRYCLAKNRTLRGMAREASALILEAIAQKSTSPISQQPSSPIAQQPNIPISQIPSSPAMPGEASEARKRKARRRSPLDEIEDIDIIRARSPEALMRSAEERGLRARDLTEDGYPGLVAVWKPSFADFVKTAAETESPPLQQVEGRAREVLKRGKPVTLEDKAAVMLFLLSRMGEIFWDGRGWVVPGRARPAPPLQEQLRQQQEKPRAEPTAVSTEKPSEKPPAPADQQAQAQQPQQADERTRRWLEFFEKEFPRLKTAMLVWSVKNAEALRRLAEQHGLIYYAITAEKAVVLRREYISDACAYANDRKWTREAVGDMVANTLRSKPHALTDDELAALALEVALSLGLAIYEKGRWVPR